MKHWADADWNSIVQVTATRPGDGKTSVTFGTGFVVQVAEGATWVVTCGHVIQDGAADRLAVNGESAQSVGKERPEIDLAVLKVKGRLDARPWRLTCLHGAAADLPGWHAVGQGESRRGDVLRAKVGRKNRFSDKPGTIQRGWAFEVLGFADAEPDCFDPWTPLIDHGYSGAPVICPTQRAVFAVARYKHGEGAAGYAIAIEHLGEIWPDDAPRPAWLDTADQPVDGDTSRQLDEFFSPLPAGLTLDALRVHCERCAPPGLELDFPSGTDPCAFLFWLIRKGLLSNRHLLLYDVLACLEPAIADDLKRRRLTGIRDDIAARYGDDLDRTQPSADACSTEPGRMEIELLDQVPEHTGKRFYLEARFVPPGGQEPRTVDLGRALDRDGFDPRNATATAHLLHLLLGRLARYAHVGERVTFAFRLPWSQISLPVDRWRPTDGDPLGADFPVVVQYAPRHAGADVHWFWQQHWEALKARLSEPFPAPLGWCDSLAVDPAQAKLAARDCLEAGACIALGEPPAAPGEGESDLLRYLLGGRFAPVVLWARQAPDAPALRARVDAALRGRPLRDLAELIRALRHAVPDKPGPQDVAAHLTLLWDPPPQGEWEGLHGVGE